jgi:hypothetical protein
MGKRMHTTFTPLLAEGRHAQLDLGLHGCVSCRITGFAGPQIYLHVAGHAFEGEVPAYLLLDGGGDHMQAVRGRARRLGDDGTAVLHLTDAFSGQRRLFSRAPLVLPAHVRPLGGGEVWDTFTRDISAGGVGLVLQPGWDGNDRIAVTLALGADVSIDFEGRVLRAGPDGLGVGFTRIEPDARVLLGELTLAFHRSD